MLVIELTPSNKGLDTIIDQTSLGKGAIVTSLTTPDGKISNIVNPAAAADYDSLSPLSIATVPQATLSNGIVFPTTTTYAVVVPEREAFIPFPLVGKTGTRLAHGAFGSINESYINGILEVDNGLALTHATNNVNHYLANNIKDTVYSDLSINEANNYRLRYFITGDRRGLIVFGSTDTGYGGIGQWDIQGTTYHAKHVHFPHLKNNKNVFIKKVSGAYDSSYCLLSDGTLYAWGINNNGQLGTGNVNNQFIPVIVRTGVVNVWTETGHPGDTQNENSLFIEDTAGDLWGCGLSHQGGLGINSATNTGVSTFTKTNIKLLNTSGIKQVITRRNYFVGTGTVVLMNDGKLYATGYNGHYQWGDGTTTQRNAFAQIFNDVSLESPIVKVHYGNSYGHGSTVVALTQNGKLFFAGENSTSYDGGVGHSRDYVTSPQLVTFSEAITDFESSGAAYSHYFAVGDSGQFYTWGYNANGCLGLGHTTHMSTPTKLTLPLLTGETITKFKCNQRNGYNLSAMLTSNGRLLVCGYNGNWNLGVGHASNNVFTFIPAVHSDPFVDFKFIGNDSEMSIVAVDLHGTAHSAGNSWELENPMYQASFQKYYLN